MINDLISMSNHKVSNKTVGIHQPNYIPWMGYFYKIWASDIFVLHNNVEYTKQSFIKRVLIRKYPNAVETTYLSVPLKKHSDFVKIQTLEICHHHNWQRKHINKIYNSYHKTPFFDTYFPEVQNIILNSKEQKYLYELNLIFIKYVLRVLNCKTLLFNSSELPIANLRADAYNAEIVSYFGGNNYISGQGAKKYQSETVYKKKNIELIYNNLAQYLKKHPPQYPVFFLSNLSILDSLFYISKEGILSIFQQYTHQESIRCDIAG